ncbi:MAG: hypothetical protein KGZ92_10660 [Firmicutes bacterium]|nr:hypothetical protein [Dethiobacter sp.]MBS3889728.1 hypothetical protein [Bacillota bacterium]MBS4053495.1 hypothetical protein [Thermaerobacter sp.]
MHEISIFAALDKSGPRLNSIAELDPDAIFTAAIAAKAGYPSITVPAGYTTEGKPLGLTFTARAYEETTLIRLAYSFEQGTELRKPPSLLR